MPRLYPPKGVQSLGGETDISTNINSAEWFINTVSMWKVHWQKREGGDYFLPAPLPQWDRVIADVFVEEVIPIYSGFWRAFWAVSWDTKTQKDMAGGWMVVEVSGWEGEEGSNVKSFRCWPRVRQMMRSHRRPQGVERYGKCKLPGRITANWWGRSHAGGGEMVWKAMARIQTREDEGQTQVHGIGDKVERLHLRRFQGRIWRFCDWMCRK